MDTGKRAQKNIPIMVPLAPKEVQIMKSVLISIRPMWCEKIAARWKTMELRKTKPSIPLPFKCYIYQTRFKWVFSLLRSLKMGSIADALEAGFGKVIGEFVCDHIMGRCEMSNADLAEQQSFVRRKDIFKYSGGKEVFGWHISDLVIYDKPKELCEFYKVGTLSASDWEYQLYDGSGDPSRRSYASYLFTKAIRKPPQSWCYVEDLG